MTPHQGPTLEVIPATVEGRWFVRRRETGRVYGRPLGWTLDKANAAAEQWEADARQPEQTAPG